MKAIEKILDKLETCLKNESFEPLETEKVEIKDLSTKGEWQSFYETVCAFLNTDGGIIIIGVKEKNKKYYFTGYDENNESKIKEISGKFTDENNQLLDLSECFPSHEIHDLFNGRVCVVYVDKLSEDAKYVFYNNVAYERKLTGDHKIDREKIEFQNERREEIRNARELTTVFNADLDNLNVDKLNNYLILLNKDVKVESLKADIQSALSFLNRKGFVQNNLPTLLGMLVCGDRLDDFLAGRAQVDCYVESEIQIAQNKQIIRDNIIPLMETSVGFVYKNIQVGVSHERAGRSLPEYPEKLIREIINNALAHRDYGVNKFVNINIKPNKSIEVRNPGSFRREQRIYIDDEQSKIKIRRIIPIAKARNPKLADILKVFNKWEGKGIGMASLTNACLENEINVPYYIFHSENDVSLFVQKGKVFDEEAALWLDSFSGYLYEKLNRRELTEEERIVLTYIYKSERLNRKELYTILLTADNNHFSVIADLADNGLIFKHKDSPQIYPIYLVDRTLTKSDFSQELYDIFGSHFDVLPNDYKKILNAIYLHNSFSNPKAVTAYSIAAYVYYKEKIVVTDVKEYDNFKRKVRTIFNNLEKKQLIYKLNKDNLYRPQFFINKKFKVPQDYLNFES